MELIFPDPGAVQIWKCHTCQSEAAYALGYITLGLATCTSRKCRGNASEIGESLVKVMGYRFEGVEVKSSRKTFKFTCNNGHQNSLYFEALRNGKICPRCTKLKDVKNRTKHAKKAAPVPKITCNCMALGLTYGSYAKLCQHYNFKALCPEQALEWSPNNSVGPEQVAPKCNSKYLFICAKCNREYSAIIAERHRGGGCSYCNGNHKLSEEKSLAFKHPELVKEWDPENTLKPTEVFAGSDIKVGWICALGHKWKTKVLCRTSSSKTGCPVCNGNGLTKDRGAHELFVKESTEIHGGKYSYPEEYTTSKDKIRIICPVHGDFYQSAYDHKAGHGCVKCGMGRRITAPVKRIIAKLEELGYKSDTEITFPGLKYINALSVDLIVPELNLAIEYDGAQHFKPVELWGGMDAFQDVIGRDRCKDKYFLERGISFVRIPFTCDDNIETMVPQIANMAKSDVIYMTYQHHFDFLKPAFDALEKKPRVIIY